MKSIIFDNAGTILKRITVLNDVTYNKLIYETNTIGIANQKKSRIIIVLQESVDDLLTNNSTIYDYLLNNVNNFEISYSQINCTKEDVIAALKNDKTVFSAINRTIDKLLSDFDVEIISGCALIADIQMGKIEYVYTAGGIFFKDTRNVISYAKKVGLSIYIASGDNKQSLTKIASILSIPYSNINSTLDSNGKLKLVHDLQEKGHFVYMVGNHTNDKLAIKQANVGILNLEQGEQLPNSLKKVADYTVNSIGEIINILKKDNEV